MKKDYRFKKQRLVIRDFDLSLAVDEPFNPRLVPAYGVSVDELVVEHDQTGLVVAAYFEQEGVLDGQYCTYYLNGQIKHSCFYKQGDLQGPSYVYSDTGSCLAETWFYCNHRVGEAKRYYISGYVHSIERFCNGLLHSKQEYYYQDGTLKSELYYAQGQLDGPSHLYWPNGQKKRESVFKCGRQVGGDYLWNEGGVLIHTANEASSEKRGNNGC